MDSETLRLYGLYLKRCSEAFGTLSECSKSFPIAAGILEGYSLMNVDDFRTQIETLTKEGRVDRLRQLLEEKSNQSEFRDVFTFSMN